MESYGASCVAQTVNNLPAMQETQIRSLGYEDSLEKGMAIHSSILVWRIPWTEEPGGLQSMGWQRVRHDWATNTFPFIPCSWIWRPNNVKISVLSNLIYILYAISRKISVNNFVDFDKLTLKFLWKGKRPNNQHNIEGEGQSWRTDTSQLQYLL